MDCDELLIVETTLELELVCLLSNASFGALAAASLLLVFFLLCHSADVAPDVCMLLSVFGHVVDAAVCW